jgi:hypothetical protein
MTDGGHGGRCGPPVLANLLLGVPALAPLCSAQWLLTEYPPMDSRSPAAIVGSTNCDHHTLDHAGPRTAILLLTGPRRRAVPLRIWGLPG